MSVARADCFARGAFAIVAGQALRLFRRGVQSGLRPRPGYRGRIDHTIWARIWTPSALAFEIVARLVVSEAIDWIAAIKEEEAEARRFLADRLYKETARGA